LKRKKDVPKKKKKIKIVQNPHRFPGEPKPNKNELFIKFVQRKIKFLKGVKKHQLNDTVKHKKQRVIIKQHVEMLELLLEQWDKEKPL
jgi:hypothetical protein